MAKRVMRFSPEFIEDLTHLVKDPEWCAKVRSGFFKVTVDVEHEDGEKHVFPIKVDMNAATKYYRVEWEVSDEEEAFERLVFRQLRTK